MQTKRLVEVWKQALYKTDFGYELCTYANDQVVRCDVLQLKDNRVVAYSVKRNGDVEYLGEAEDVELDIETIIDFQITWDVVTGESLIAEAD